MSPVVPPPLGREPLFWRKHALIVAGGIATAIGGGIVSSGSTWIGGIATRGYVDTEVKRVEVTSRAALDAANAMRGAVEILATRTRELEDERSRHLHAITELESERIGLRVALHVGLDPKRRKAADDASAGARAVFKRELISAPANVDQGARVHETAERVLMMRGVPR